MAHAVEVAPAMSMPQLDKARHVKYWTRCIKTLLPHQYTSLDSNRMYLGYFILAALDVLHALETVCSEAERHDYVDWIYRCQCPGGGFRMWRGTDFGELANDGNGKWDPANVPGTWFALVSLLILGDDFKRIKRKQTLQWLRKMQRPDGSFGETLVEGQIEGGMDPRYGYCAAGIRYVLRGTMSGPLDLDGEEVQDIAVNMLVTCIRQAEAFDGGIADQPFNEPHAGYTFCALGALNFVGRLKKAELPPSAPSPQEGPSNPQEVVRWLVYRQTDSLDPDANNDSAFVGDSMSAKITDRELESILPSDAAPPGHNDTIDIAKVTDSELENILPTHAPPPGHSEAPKPDMKPSGRDGTGSHGATTGFDWHCAGMNGRTNKIADTCYAWWSGASLHILGQPTLYDREAVQKYLLGKTQHGILGGFGKFPGDLPDLYHSYLGLTALSIAGSTEVKKVDAGMCISEDAKARLKSVWKSWGIDSPQDGP